ncbi:MAG: hypothetical protein ACXVHI_06695 [Frankiaceae bacterium]
MAGAGTLTSSSARGYRKTLFEVGVVGTFGAQVAGELTRLAFAGGAPGRGAGRRGHIGWVHATSNSGEGEPAAHVQAERPVRG